jgi:hypothetical protein
MVLEIRRRKRLHVTSPPRVDARPEPASRRRPHGPELRSDHGWSRLDRAATGIRRLRPLRVAQAPFTLMGYVLDELEAHRLGPECVGSVLIPTPIKALLTPVIIRPSPWTIPDLRCRPSE